MHNIFLTSFLFALNQTIQYDPFDITGPCNLPMLAQNVYVGVAPQVVSYGDYLETITSYDLGYKVDEGTYTYKTTLSGFPIVNENGDLCAKLSGSQTPCPLYGELYSKDRIQITSDVPKGTYRSTAIYRLLNGTDIICVNYEFTVA